jgi:hypothetical protein
MKIEINRLPTGKQPCQERGRQNLRGHSIVISPFSELLLCEVKTIILFKIGRNNVQLGELAEAEAMLSCTDQIQLEMIPIRRNY